jgi:hypothetical protein
MLSVELDRRKLKEGEKEVERSGEKSKIHKGQRSEN